MRTLITVAGLVDGSGIRGDAVMINDDRIERVGWAKDLRATGVDEIGFPELHLLPGLRDGHVHLGGWTALLSGLDLGRVTDFAGLADAVVAYAATLDRKSPVIGTGLDDTRLVEGRLPTRHDLDRILPSRPLLLYRHCSHVAVANTAALTMAAIGPATPDPVEGVLDRDPTGTPTGVLRERAISLVASTLAPLVRTPPPEQLVRSSHRLAASGLTGIEAMVSAGAPVWCGTGNELENLSAVAGDLPIGIEVWVIADEPEDLAAAAERIHTVGGRLRFAGWKGFADGSLGGRTAALARPYTDDETTRGMLVFDHARTTRMADISRWLGGGATVHAIGDRAVDETLGWCREMIESGHPPEMLRIEHASMMSEEAIELLAGLGVTASVQPLFVSTDHPWVRNRVGPGRVGLLHPFASLAATGVRMIGGSDAPVEVPDPWRGMTAAMEHVTNPGQALTASQALTLFGAGSLREGDRADLVLVDRNPLTTPRPTDVTVEKVMIGGRFVPIDDDRGR